MITRGLVITFFLLLRCMGLSFNRRNTLLTWVAGLRSAVDLSLAMHTVLFGAVTSFTGSSSRHAVPRDRSVSQGSSLRAPSTIR